MTDVYESNKSLSEYLLFHYGTEKEILPYEFGPKEALEFPRKCVRFLIENSVSSNGMRALDLGCAVGAATFELSHYYDAVVGIDRSASFIDAAKTLQTSRSIEFDRFVEGKICRKIKVEIPQNAAPDNIDFHVGDACNLSKSLGQFDVVLMANLIDRLPNPRGCLEAISDFIVSGGTLMITSPYTWLEEYTATEQWLGGKVVNDTPNSTFESLQHVLGDDFAFACRKDISFLIREHERKYQWSVAEASLWRRK